MLFYDYDCVADPAVFCTWQLLRFNVLLNRQQYDIEEQYNIAKPPRQSSNPTSVLKEALKHLPKDEAKEQRRFITQHEKNHASIDMVNVCESCREGLATLPEGTQLKACVQCKSIGRTYRYCSRCVSSLGKYEK